MKSLTSIPFGGPLGIYVDDSGTLKYRKQAISMTWELGKTAQLNPLIFFQPGNLALIDVRNSPQYSFRNNFRIFKHFYRKIEILFFPKNCLVWYLGFVGKSKNARAEISRKTHRRMPRDLSYEADSGRKTKTENRSFFRPLKIEQFFKASKAKLGSASLRF